MPINRVCLVLDTLKAKDVLEFHVAYVDRYTRKSNDGVIAYFPRCITSEKRTRPVERWPHCGTACGSRVRHHSVPRSWRTDGPLFSNPSGLARTRLSVRERHYQQAAAEKSPR
ncbi:hypothetical protein MRX96_027142 [Rhipicephalus microplus]